MIKTVLFDLGDTLGYFDVPDRTQMQEIRVSDLINFLRSQKIGVDAENFKQVFIKISSDILKKSEEESIEIPINEVFVQVFEELNFSLISANLLNGMEKAFYRILIDRWVLFDDTFETLQKLTDKNYMMAIVSNVRSDMFVQEVVRKTNIDIFFPTIITSAKLKLRKPRPQLFLDAIKDLNAKPNQTIVVGDTLQTDIQGGDALKIKTIHVNRNKIEKINIKPTETIINLIELLPILDKWNRGSF